MTAEQTRRRPQRYRPERSTTVLHTSDENPLGDVGGRVREGIATWLRSPALDFYALLVIGGLLLGIGLVMVLSSSMIISLGRGESPYAGLISQGRFALIGLPLLVLAALLRPGFYRRMAWPLLLLGFALQVLVFTPLGFGAGGNRNWIRIGSMTLQPSELLKLALAVWIASIVAMKRPLMNQPKHLLFPIAPVIVIALGLVLYGHDLGTAMVMCMLIAGSLWVAGVPRRWFALAAAVGVVGVTGMVLTSANRMARITTWLHGECVGSSCYQADHGLMALAEGGWWGVGLGESRQKWGLLPAADNDYIFAVLGEEMGLFGTLGVLALFAALALVLLRMITRIDDLFVQVAVAGISAWLLGQAFTNMMVVTGLLPVLGVPLPFISAGGSALVTSMTALGVLLSFARHEPGAADAIRARVGRVRRGATVVPAPAGAQAAPRSARARRRSAAKAARAASRSSASGASSRGRTTTAGTRGSSPRRGTGTRGGTGARGGTSSRSGSTASRAGGGSRARAGGGSRTGAAQPASHAPSRTRRTRGTR